MKITVVRDDGKVKVFQEVTDFYLAYRQYHPIVDTTSKQLSVQPETRSHSDGPRIRELAKEIFQSWVELERLLPAAQVTSTATVKPTLESASSDGHTP